jgi:hypothetical protein
MFIEHQHQGNPESLNAVVWPSAEFDSFPTALAHSLKHDCRLILKAGSHTHLDEIIDIKNAAVVIVGETSGASKADLPKIESTAHSIFQVSGKRSSLTLKNVKLLHSRSALCNRDNGAGVFCRNSSRAVLSNCDVFSTHGFGLWATQNSQLRVFQSSISSLRRSGVVIFGDALASLERCSVHDCAVHGVCLRGRSALFVKDSSFTNNTNRAIYGYDNVTVAAVNSEFHGTKSTIHAAIDFYGECIYYGMCFDSFATLDDSMSTAMTSDTASNTTTNLLTVRRRPAALSSLKTGLWFFLSACRISHNAGCGVRVISSSHSSTWSRCAEKHHVVPFALSDCTVECNAEGNFISGVTVVSLATKANSNNTNLDVLPALFDEGGDGDSEKLSNNKNVPMCCRPRMDRRSGRLIFFDIDELCNPSRNVLDSDCSIVSAGDIEVDSNQYDQLFDHLVKKWQYEVEDDGVTSILGGGLCQWREYSKDVSAFIDKAFESWKRCETTASSLSSLNFNGCSPKAQYENNSLLPACVTENEHSLDIATSFDNIVMLPHPLSSLCIDFKEMVQININTFYSRRVRRL